MTRPYHLEPAAARALALAAAHPAWSLAIGAAVVLLWLRTVARWRRRGSRRALTRAVGRTSPRRQLHAIRRGRLLGRDRRARAAAARFRGALLLCAGAALAYGVLHLHHLAR